MRCKIYVCVCFAAVSEADDGPEHHRRSSSMRVTGTSYRGSIRERSSDDCIIGTHLGMGTLHTTTSKARVFSSSETSLTNKVLLVYSTKLLSSISRRLLGFIPRFQKLSRFFLGQTLLTQIEI